MLSQIAIETLYSNKHKTDILREELKGLFDEEKAQEALQSVCKAFEVDTPSIWSILLITALWRAPEPLVGGASSIGHLFSEDRPVGAAIGAEVLLALEKATSLIEVYQHGLRWMVRNCIDLEGALDGLIYTPPMVSKPNPLKSNDDSPYYTLGDSSLLLGDYRNHHEGNICLDVINIQNQVKLYLDWEFINQCDEPTKHQGDYEEQYQKDAEIVRKLLGKRGFYVTNKIDNRGRLYAQGYHINPQGMDYQKAMLSLEPEICI
jgi:N4 RNAP1-like protein